MTISHDEMQARRQAEHAARGPAAELLESLAERLGSKASVSAVYGEPVRSEGLTIIPVAKVRFGFGGGGGTGNKETETGEGGGGGGSTSSTPVGYIEVKNGNAAFKPIRPSTLRFLLPWAVVLGGWALPRIVRAIRNSD